MAGKGKSKQRDVWVGFDLGGTKMLAKVYDKGLTPLGAKRRRTKGHEGTEAGLQRMADTIRAALADAGVESERLSGIGVGAPGPLDMESGSIPDTPNLGWRNARVRSWLKRTFKCPAVVINDVDAGVYGEYCFGVAKGARCVVGVFPGTGIGGGCVYDGTILRGTRYSCMELGHIPLVPDGPRCGCGKRGCLEAVASRLAISSAAAAAAYRGDAPYLLAAAGMDLSNIRSGVLRASVEAGDKAVELILRDAARWLGVGIGSVVNLLLPDVVVLGGGLVEEMPALFLTEIEKRARGTVMPAFKNVFKVKVAQLGDDATVLGAAAWAKRVLQSGK